MNGEIIQSEFRQLAEERAKDVLFYAAKAVIVGWFPALAGGLVGRLIDLLLPILLAPLANQLARFGNFLKVDAEEQGKLERYQPQEVKLRALLERIKDKSPDELTDEEKKDEADYDNALDDVIRWD